MYLIYSFKSRLSKARFFFDPINIGEYIFLELNCIPCGQKSGHPPDGLCRQQRTKIAERVPLPPSRKCGALLWDFLEKYMPNSMVWQSNLIKHLWSKIWHKEQNKNIISGKMVNGTVNEGIKYNRRYMDKRRLDKSIKKHTVIERKNSGFPWWFAFLLCFVFVATY